MAADELVDVVDADDNVIGQATRAEMRARRLRHRATYILVFNSQGQLFVRIGLCDGQIVSGIRMSPRHRLVRSGIFLSR